MFNTVTEIIAANKAAGGHYFDAGALRFFRSRIGKKVFGGYFFCTSEQFRDESPRLYSVKFAMPDGHIDSASEFQEFATAKAAERAAKQYASGEIYAEAAMKPLSWVLKPRGLMTSEKNIGNREVYAFTSPALARNFHLFYTFDIGRAAQFINAAYNHSTAAGQAAEHILREIERVANHVRQYGSSGGGGTPGWEY